MDFKTVSGLIIPEGEVTQIADASGTVLWKKQSGGEYTSVEYINVPASAKIDTGVAIVSSDYIYVDFAPMQATMYGTIWYAGTSKVMRVYIDGSSIQGKIDWYNQTMGTTSVGTRVNMTFAKQVVTISTGKTTSMAGVPSFTPNTNLTLGGINGKWRFYGLEHGSSADALDLDYVPVVRNSDGAAGMYDNITKTFTPYGTAP